MSVTLDAVVSANATATAFLWGTQGFSSQVGDSATVTALGFAYPPSNLTVLTSRISSSRSRLRGGEYQIWVGLTRFDTSDLPYLAVVTGARLLMDVASSTSSDNRQCVGEYYASSNWPIDTSDWTNTAPVSPIFAINLTDITVGQLSIPLTDYSGIDQNGYTGFRLHISGGQPVGNNLVQADIAEPLAQLIIEYQTWPRTTAPATATAEASLGIAKPLNASAIASAAAPSAALALLMYLEATVDETAAVLGGMSKASPLLATAQAGAFGSSWITQAVPLQAVGQAAAAADPSLSVVFPVFEGLAVGTSATAGALTLAIPVVAVATAGAGLSSGGITLVVHVAAVGASQATTEAGMNNLIAEMEATGAAGSAMNGGLLHTIPLSGTAPAVATGAAVIVIPHELLAIAIAQASQSVMLLPATHPLSAASASGAASFGAVSVTIRMRGIAAVWTNAFATMTGGTDAGGGDGSQRLIRTDRNKTKARLAG